LLLTIEDSGPGIAAADVERLFESFFTTKLNGMGMGLPICRSIVENCGGSIVLQPRPSGQGACFAIQLPPVTT
jgi:signal transduction histidine kinase